MQRNTKIFDVPVSLDTPLSCTNKSPRLCQACQGSINSDQREEDMLQPYRSDVGTHTTLGFCYGVIVVVNGSRTIRNQCREMFSDVAAT